MNPRKAEAFEPFGWWYAREFPAPESAPGERVFLRLDGVDCLAEYFLNGERIGASENAFMPHEFDVTDRLRPQNALWVHIRSALLEQLSQPYAQYLLTGWHIDGGASLRKPAHSFGLGHLPAGGDGRAVEERVPGRARRIRLCRAGLPRPLRPRADAQPGILLQRGGAAGKARGAESLRARRRALRRGLLLLRAVRAGSGQGRANRLRGGESQALVALRLRARPTSTTRWRSCWTARPSSRGGS